MRCGRPAPGLRRCAGEVGTMKKALYISFLAVVAVGGIIFFTRCELFVGESNYANLGIDLWGSDENPESTSRAISGPTGIGIIAYTVTVTADNMETIQKTVSAGTRYLNMYIPTGKERTVRLDAVIDPDWATANDREHLISFAGERTVDIQPGRFLFLVFTMHEGMMKLLIQDPGNNRVARIPYMNPTDAMWAQANISSVQDIAYDGLGRIYYVTGTNEVMRADAFVPPPSPYFYTIPIASLNAVAVDSRNPLSIIVYAANSFSGSIGWRNIASGTSGTYTPTPLNLNAIYSLRFEDGILYGTGRDTATSNQVVFRYPVGGPATSVTAASANRSWRDVLVKGNRLLVTSYPITPDNVSGIDVYNKNTLAFIGSYGSWTDTPNDDRVGYFYGPHHFIAPSNRKIFVIDDGRPAGAGQNRVISFEKPGSWEDWKTFHAEDLTAGTEFRFYEYSFC